MEYRVVKLPGHPHVHFIYVPSQDLVVHRDGLQPLVDRKLIEIALRLALVGDYVVNYRYSNIRMASVPYFVYVNDRGIFVNVADALKPVSQNIEVSLCPELYGYRYYYRLYYEKVRRDDHDDFERRIEREYVPFYVPEDSGSSEDSYMVLVKMVRPLVAILYKIQDLQGTSTLHIRATALGYVPFRITSIDEVCSEDGQLKRSCYLGSYLEGKVLWSISYEVEEKEVKWRDYYGTDLYGHESKASHVFAFSKISENEYELTYGWFEDYQSIGLLGSSESTRIIQYRASIPHIAQ